MDYSNTSPINPAPHEAPAAAPPHPQSQPLQVATRPQAASPAPPEVAINQANAITVAEALHIARQMGVAIGKSTLQRWAKTWAEIPEHGVKSVLLVTRHSRHYEIDRDDFESWLLEQQQNQQTLPDPARPDGVSQSLPGSHETLEDTAASHKTSSEAPDPEIVTEQQDRIAELEEENLQLKIDVGVRRGLVAQAKIEIDKMRGGLEQILKENGALEFQLRQLSAPTRVHDQIEMPIHDQPPGDNEDKDTAPLVY